jgi:electron transfer flavoprotein beta subunit
MKIAVCIKQVPTREWQPRLRDDKTWIREQDVSYEMNEPDAYALEEALRLREKHGGEVVVCSAGPARVQQVLREALARGADRALHVEDDSLASADACVSAGALAAAMADEKFDLVLTGLQSDDQGHGQAGVVLAERLGIPHSTIIMEIQVRGAEGPAAGGLHPSTVARGAVSEVERQASGVRVKRELEGGWFQWLAMPLPALLTIQSGINQLRYATLKGIMAAKKKEIRKVPLPPGLTPSQQIVALALPTRSKQTQMITGSPSEVARELVRRLREEARAL